MPPILLGKVREKNVTLNEHIAKFVGSLLFKHVGVFFGTGATRCYCWQISRTVRTSTETNKRIIEDDTNSRTYYQHVLWLQKWRD